MAGWRSRPSWIAGITRWRLVSGPSSAHMQLGPTGWPLQPRVGQLRLPAARACRVRAAVASADGMALKAVALEGSALNGHWNRGHCPNARETDRIRLNFGSRA